MQFLDTVDERGVCERRFDIACDGRTVPGVLWTPSPSGEVRGDGPSPLVLVGHGAGFDKRAPYILSLARRLVRHHRIAAVAIDGPEHGDRPRHQGAVDGRGAWWSDDITDETIADWQAVIAAVQALPDVGEGSLAYWGLSMGTILGLPLVAAESRIVAAVLGLMGIAGPTRDRIAADAERITCPLLFLVQWDDQLFDRSLAFDLFEAISSTDKRLHAHPGPHSSVPVEGLDASEAFLAKHLLAAQA